MTRSLGLTSFHKALAMPAKGVGKEVSPEVRSSAAPL
jgi:hypothetical protein